jgi:hypothetical protein
MELNLDAGRYCEGKKNLSKIGFEWILGDLNQCRG